MISILNILAFLIPFIGMVAGLFSAALITAFLVMLVLYLQRSGDYTEISLRKIEQSYIIFFALWCFCSIFWSGEALTSLGVYLQAFPLILLGLIIVTALFSASDQSLSLLSRFDKAIFAGVIGAIILFFIEYQFGGFVSNTFRHIIQPNSATKFALYHLDRGCAILAVSGFLAISSLIRAGRAIYAVLLYIAIFMLLKNSDSLASFLGFFAAGLAFALTYIFKAHFVKMLKLLVILGSLLMPVIAYKIDPAKLSNEYYDILPDSAKHRLFIWHFTATQIAEKSLFGGGIGASRIMQISPNQMIDYNDNHWSPLPVHPHNHVLQILFETGLVGLGLFLAIIYQLLSAIERALLEGQGGASRVKLSASVNASCGAALSSFVAYYIIAMISFNIWQAWWVCLAVWMWCCYSLQFRVFRGQIFKDPINYSKN